MNLAAIEDMNRKFPHAELCFVESGGDNLAATFSPELADLTIYVIDVAEGEKIPRKGGPVDAVTNIGNGITVCVDLEFVQRSRFERLLSRRFRRVQPERRMHVEDDY